MVGSLVVPVDRSAISDRGVAVAVALARRAGIPVRLVAVCGPDQDPAAVAEALRTRAARAASVECTATVLEAPEVEAALADAIVARPDSLVVMGTHARHPLGELLVGSVAESLLAGGARPFVLVGPHVDVVAYPAPEHLVVGVDGEASAAALAAVVGAWERTFAATTRVVEVATRAHAVVGAWDVVEGRDPVDALIGVADEVGGAVLAVGTERWGDPDHVHWSSTARHLVHCARYPVLVQPIRP